MRLRYGVLITLVIVALVLWWSAAVSWWSAEFVLLDGVPDTELGLGAFGGDWFTGAAVVAGAGYAIAAVPSAARVRRIALAAGGAATAVAVGALIPAAAGVLRQDAAAHREWTPQVWSYHLARRAESFDYFSVADTGSPGLFLAMIVTSLLVIVGLLLALPRRHERTTLIAATMAALLAVVLLPVSGWVTSSPRTVDRIWIWLPDHLDHRPVAVVVLLADVLLMGAGLFLRPRHRVHRRVSRAWSILTLTVGMAVFFGLLVVRSPLADPIPYAETALDEGISLAAPAVLALVLPFVAVIRVASLDAREPQAPNAGPCREPDPHLEADPYLTASDAAAGTPESGLDEERPLA